MFSIKINIKSRRKRASICLFRLQINENQEGNEHFFKILFQNFRIFDGCYSEIFEFRGRAQHATYGIDAGIPRGDQSANEIDQSLYDIVPDILRQDLLGLFSVMNSEAYDQSDSGLWYMGTFGPSFNSQGWNDAYDWLSQ